MQNNAIFNHRNVIDQSGHKVGTVSDVVADPTTLEPRWLVVDAGLMRSSHYVPVSGAEHTPTGEIMVPFDKSTVRQAVKAHGSHVPSNVDEQDLGAHYHLVD